MPRVLLAGLWMLLGCAKALHAGPFVTFLGDQGVPEQFRKPAAAILIGGGDSSRTADASISAVGARARGFIACAGLTHDHLLDD